MIKTLLGMAPSVSEVKSLLFSTAITTPEKASVLARIFI